MPNAGKEIEEDFFESKTRLESILFFFGCIIFIALGTFVILHLGFVNTTIHHNPNPNQFLTQDQLWLTNLSLGIVGGFFLCPRTPILAIISGILSSASITLFTILYMDWRSTIMMVEFLIPLGLGIVPGIMLYQQVIKSRKVK